MKKSVFVKNFVSAHKNVIANQFIITIDGIRYYQSYDSIIAKDDNGQITLDEYYWNYSRTTGKYRNIFLGENTAETRRKISEGIYKLANLN